MNATDDYVDIDKLRQQQGGRCATCWQRPATILARIIPLTECNIDRYGRIVLDHEKNCRVVCTDPKCSDFWDIKHKTHSETLLVAEICIAIVDRWVQNGDV